MSKPKVVKFVIRGEVVMEDGNGLPEVMEHIRQTAEKARTFHSASVKVDVQVPRLTHVEV